MVRHHRKPKSHGGKGHKRNISIVPEDQHKAWHLLFGNLTPLEIALVINERWLDADWILVPQRNHAGWKVEQEEACCQCHDCFNGRSET